MQIQTRKIVNLTPQEVEAILADNLQSRGIMEDGDEVTVKNVSEVIYIQLQGKIKVLSQSKLKLDSLTARTKLMESQGETTTVAKNHTDSTIQSLNILSKSISGNDEVMLSRSVFDDPIGDKLKPVVT